MKRPALNEIAQGALHSFLRFPLVIFCALMGTVLGIYLVEIREVADNLFPHINLMLCFALGIPLYLAVHIFDETHKLSKGLLALLYFLATGVLILIYLTLPDQDQTSNTSLPYIRYAIYNVCAHLFVAFFPYVFRQEENGFWHYNILLFIRILTSLFYSLVLYIGISLALLALHLLFDLEFDEKIYLQVFIMIIGLFNTWLFVSGITKNLSQLEQVHLYPKIIKAFSYYVLLPLLLLYFLILYSYGFRIMLIWDWPRGIVSYMVLCISILGITTFLLLYPYGFLQGNSWIRKASKVFYILMLPLLALLFIALKIRIDDYGFTINRYLILILGIWLGLTCAYFIFSRGNIKFIAISLALIFFLASFGPWGVFSVSEKSQVKRLHTLLSRENLIVENRLKEEIIWDRESLPVLEPVRAGGLNHSLADSLYAEVSSIMHYLDQHHGFQSIHPWFTQDLSSILQAVNQDKLTMQKMQEAQIYMETLGLDYHRALRNTSENFYAFEADLKQHSTSVQPFDYLIYFNINELDQRNFVIHDKLYQLSFNSAQNGLMLRFNQEKINIDLHPTAMHLIAENNQGKNGLVPIQEMVIQQNMEEIDFLLEFHQMNLQNTAEEKIRFSHLSGFLLIREK